MYSLQAVRASFSPEILQAGALEGLIILHKSFLCSSADEVRYGCIHICCSCSTT